MLTRKRTWDGDNLIDLAKAAGLDVGGFLKTGKSVDAAAAVALLSDLVEAYKAGEDVTPRLTRIIEDGLPVERKHDFDAIAEALEEQGVDTIEVAQVRESFALTRKKKGEGAERLAELRNAVSEIIEALDDVVREDARKIILGQREPEQLPEL